MSGRRRVQVSRGCLAARPEAIGRARLGKSAFLHLTPKLLLYGFRYALPVVHPAFEEAEVFRKADTWSAVFVTLLIAIPALSPE